MLGIIVCDDEKEQLQLMTRALRDAIAVDNLDASILMSTGNPQDLVKFFEQKQGLFYVSLDLIYGGKPTGVELAKLIRQKDKTSYIVFATRYMDKMHLAFEGLIRPSGFFKKPVTIKEYMDNFLSAYCEHIQLLKKDSYYSITVGTRYYKILTSTICYFEASQKKIFINTDTQRIGFYDSLDAILNKVDSKMFVRCHKGFIVNIEKIVSIDYSEMLISLSNGAEIPLSRTYKPNLKELFD